MSDQKSAYSQASKYYVEAATGPDAVNQNAYNKSKERERKYGENWNKQKVNLNEICDEFAPGDMGEIRGQKFIFEGDRFVVQADMAAGYLRIWDKELKSHVRLDKTPSSKEIETHFKIKRREEM